MYRVECNYGIFDLDPDDGITEDASTVFTRGHCHSLALALNELIPGSELYGVQYDNVGLWGPRDIPGHVILHLPDGRFLDVDGVYDHETELGLGTGEPIDREWALGGFADEDGDERYRVPERDLGWGGTSLDVARAFAPIVLNEYVPELAEAVAA